MKLLLETRQAFVFVPKAFVLFKQTLTGIL